MFYFNPRSRVGNDILSIKFARTTLTFQSTFPRGERRKTIDNVKAEEKFQSTFPRGERPYCFFTIDNYNGISIHVPAWGTTGTMLLLRVQLIISIHVPAWGTTGKTMFFHGLPLFQSTFPRGERRLADHSCTTRLIFQSTFPRGERLFLPDVVLIGLQFQSTFPRGERPEGNVLSQMELFISIHVPAWGTT